MGGYAKTIQWGLNSMRIFQRSLVQGPILPLLGLIWLASNYALHVFGNARTLFPSHFSRNGVGHLLPFRSMHGQHVNEIHSYALKYIAISKS